MLTIFSPHAHICLVLRTDHAPLWNRRKARYKKDLILLFLFILFFPFSVWLLPLNLRRTKQLNTMNAWVDRLYQRLYIWFIDHYYKDLQDIYIMWEMKETWGGSAAYMPFWVQMWLPCSLVMHQSVIKIREYYRMLCYRYQWQWHNLLN